MKPEEISSDAAPVLEVALKQELDRATRWKGFEPFVLSRLPSVIRENNKDLYEPRVVSVGPFHWGKASLGAMEAHKARCLVDFLERISNVGVEVYIEKTQGLESRARHCYGEAIDMSRDEFARMLLLDGCFILEFFFKIRAREPHMLLHVGWGVRTIISDLLLFENQIPFFIVETLYTVLNDCASDRESLLDLLQPYSIAPELPAGDTIFHLLHLYYQWFTPGRISKSNSSSTLPSIPSSFRSSSELTMQSRQIPYWLRISSIPCEKPYKQPMWSIPCATELHEAGITFRKKKSPCDAFDVTFEKGVMEMPTFLIDPFRRVFYLNLAAFEQSSSAMDHELMGYVALMNALIKTNKDVVFLQRCGIINNMLLNEDELAAFFSQFGGWITLYSDKHHFSPLFADVQRYCKSRWHKYRARLMHDYFSNPWSALSVLAAVVLLIFSAIPAVGTLIMLYRN